MWINGAQMKSYIFLLSCYLFIFSPALASAEPQDIVPIPIFKTGACGEPVSLYSQCGAGEGYLLGIRTIEEFLRVRPSQIKCPRNTSYSKVTGAEHDTTLGVTRTFFPYVCCCINPGVVTSLEDIHAE